MQSEASKGTPPLRTRKQCLHGRRKAYCRECKGSQICSHDRVKSCCKECKGSRVCAHNRAKEFCKDCKGSQICPHERRKAYCKECKGSQICTHNKTKALCKTCNGSQICSHNRFKTQCKECKGSQICFHGRLKYRCKECEGFPKSGLCSHNHRKEYCRKCKGSQICIHDKLKYFCSHCGGSRLCSLCHFTQVPRNKQVCAKCLPRPYHTSPFKEIKLAARLQDWASEEMIPAYSFWNKQNPLADPSQCGKYRVDFIFELEDKVVLLECDENQHGIYDQRCELIRQAHVSLGFGGLPVHWIRYNPDMFKLNGIVSSTNTKDRESVLLKQLQLAVQCTDFDHFIAVTYVCYNKATPASGSLENDLIETLRFKTIDDYTDWIEQKTR